MAANDNICCKKAQRKLKQFVKIYEQNKGSKGLGYSYKVDAPIKKLEVSIALLLKNGWKKWVIKIFYFCLLKAI